MRLFFESLGFADAVPPRRAVDASLIGWIERLVAFILISYYEFEYYSKEFLHDISSIPCPKAYRRMESREMMCPESARKMTSCG